MISDLRVCFLGDSFVAGVGDPEHLGWVGRIAARSHRGGQALTANNLGVRRQTTRDVLARWHPECVQRLPSGSRGRVVVSLGVNDTTEEDGAVRVAPADSAAHLAVVLQGAAAAGWPALVVGPPPVGDQRQNQRTSSLDEAFSSLCADLGVGYVRVIDRLLASEVWMRQVAEGDGAHPGAAGYQELADLVWPTWRAWITGAGPYDR